MPLQDKCPLRASILAQPERGLDADMKLRTMLAAAAITFGIGTAALAQDTHTVQVGQQASGTFSWITHAIRYYGLDMKYDLNLVEDVYASKPASQLALQAGEVDVIVDDFIGAVNMREAGVPVRAIWPFSKATGGIVVPADSEIQTVADLQGHTIAAAALNDKSMLILRAYLTSNYGFDPQDDGMVMQAAAPLMQGLLNEGEIDAAIPYWHFVARMEGSGEFRDIQLVSDLLAEMGFRDDLPILVVLGRDGADPAALTAFLAAMQEAIEMMKMDSNEGIWQSILDNELYSLPDESLFPAVRARWEAGIPEEWNQEMIDDLVALVDQLVEVAGADVVGVENLDASAYTTEYNPE